MKYVKERLENNANEKWEQQFALDQVKDFLRIERKLCHKKWVRVDLLSVFQLKEIVNEFGPAVGKLYELQQRVEETMKDVAKQEQAGQRDNTIEGKLEAIAILGADGDADQVSPIDNATVSKLFWNCRSPHSKEKWSS